MQNKKKQNSVWHYLIDLKSQPWVKGMLITITIASCTWATKDFFDGCRDYFRSKNKEIILEITKEHKKRLLELQNKITSEITGVSVPGSPIFSIDCNNVPRKEYIASLNKAIADEIKSHEISISSLK